MKKTHHVFLCLPVFVLISACGTLLPTHDNQNSIKLVIEKSEPVYLSYATVNRDDDGTVVRGEARFPNAVRYGQFSGHIDLNIVSPNEKSARMYDIRLVRKRIPKVAGRRASFATNIPFQLPAGSEIRLAYHEGKHTS